ncbi:MAG: hypothetical protein ACRCSF_11950 [Mycobacteriaceae bacterium]
MKIFSVLKFWNYSWSLRARVTLAAALAAASVVTLLGCTAALYTNRAEYLNLDRKIDTITETLTTSDSLGNFNERAHSYLATLRVGTSVVRSTKIEIPYFPVGIHTAEIGGIDYRIHTKAINRSANTALLSVAIRQDSTRQTVNKQLLRVLIIGFFAITLSAVLAWVFAGRAVRPLTLLTAQTR